MGTDRTSRPAAIYEQLVSGTEQTHRLLSVHWELTYRCNERCSHCYVNILPSNTEVPGELSTVDCFRVVDELVDLGALNLLLSGGEILVRRDFFQIAAYARSRRLLLRLFTNGILINPTVADRIAALHPYAVEISVYSISPERHDQITGRQRSWEMAIGALDLLRERGVRTKMKVPLMRENWQERREMEKLADDLGAQFHFSTTITPRDNGDLSPLEHRLTYDQLVRLFREILEGDAWVDRCVAPDGRTCKIGLNSLAIDPFGNVFPCVQLRQSAGNLCTRPLRSIWEEAPIWQEIRSLTIGRLPVCRSCELRHQCLRCCGLAQVEDGDWQGPASADCREALARRQVMVEQGVLPADFPIPAHLRDLAAPYHGPC